MAVNTSAGTSIAISLDQPATEDEAGYAALTYNGIGEVESIGEFGTEYELTEFVDLSSRRKRKKKGSYDPGTTDLTLGRDATDQGQQDGKTALKMDDDVSFRVTYQDGEIEYFMGLVSSYQTDIGDADQITMASMSIAINSDSVIVPVPASP